MVAQTRPRIKHRQPLITAKLLATAAAHGTGLDLRGFDFWHKPTPDDLALVRAQAEGIRAFQISPTTWVVPSGSEPDRAYLVAVSGTNGGRRVACNCPAGQAGRRCKHGALVKQTILRTEAQQATAVLTDGPEPITKLEDLYPIA